MLVYQTVKECQSSGLSSERAFSHSGEPYVSSIVLGIKMGNHSATHKGMEIMDLLGYILTHLVNCGELALLHGLDCTSKSKQTSCIEPFREHVLGSGLEKDIIRNCTHKRLKLLKVTCATIFLTGVISENKVSKAEFLLDIVRKLKHQCL